MADPLADPRARDLLAADPGEVSAVAYSLQVVALEAEGIAGGLRVAPGSAQWWGESADAFRNTIGHYPAELDAVHASYAEAASALNHYEGELAALQSAFRALQQQLEGARRSASGLTSQLLAEGQQLGSANLILRGDALAHAKPTAAELATDARAGERVAVTSGALERVDGEASALEAHTFRILDAFAGERSTVASKLSAAARLAPKSPPWWDRALHDVGHFLEGVALTAYHAGRDLIPAIEGFVDHPGWQTFGRMAADVGALAGTAALALTLLGAPELAVEVAGGFAAFSNAMAGGSDIAEGHYADGLMMIGFSAGGEAMDLTDNTLSSFLGIGGRQAGQAEGELSALETYAKGAAPGASDEDFSALIETPNKGVESWATVEQHIGLADGSEESVAAAENSAKWQKIALEAAQNAERFKGAPLDYAFDNSVLDPLRKVNQDGLRWALHGRPFTNEGDWSDGAG